MIVNVEALIFARHGDIDTAQAIALIDHEIEHHTNPLAVIRLRWLQKLIIERARKANLCV